MKKMTIDEFLERARKVHGDKYDYSKVDLDNRDEKGRVCITCPTHGDFWQIPYDHFHGTNCPYCSNRKRLTIDEFIKRARKVHGNKYDYSKVVYTNNKEKVCVICPTHGGFWVKPNNHLNGSGCPYCAGKIKTTRDFITEAREIHGDKYDYSKVEYINKRTKVCIICQTHGEFRQLPSVHLRGYGCQACSNNKVPTTLEFIENLKKIHGDKYDYSKVEYISAKTKVCIICPIHGEFWQTPNHLLYGVGCPMCNSSHLEEEIRLFFQKNEIDFIFQKRFSWLGQQSLDFYLPQYNIGIECQGIQHFSAIEWFGGEDALKSQKERDKLKYNLCNENGVRLLYYSNLGIEYPYEVYEDKEILLEEIKRL